MRILGIDPGTARMGWGIIDTDPRLTSHSSGVFTTEVGFAHEDRLLALHNYLVNKIRVERPDVVAVEKLFFNFNVQTAMNVGEGRAMVMLAAAQNKVHVVEYTSLTAKLVLAGHGRADKKLVTSAVLKILGLKVLPNHLDDSADALAMALTHHYKLTNQSVPRIDLRLASSDRKGKRDKLTGQAAKATTVKPKISSASKSRAKAKKSSQAKSRSKRGKIS